ncbi:MAG: CcdB family protein [Betaproteobacteria bacterium]|jgi:toxin CcdB
MQYDVYLNPRPQSKDIYPYVIDVQSDLLNFLQTRLTVPLKIHRSNVYAPKNLTPIFNVWGKDLLLIPFLAPAIGKKNLKKSVCSLSQHASEIISAMLCSLSGR